MSQTLKKVIISLIILLEFVLPITALAQADFNPHFIISDTELTDWQSWDRSDIQQFLDSKGSYLRNWQTTNVSGTPEFAADIIYAAAVQYQINPKFLLVTLQKEQSLVTDDSPTQKQLDWATGYAVCDGCALADPVVQRHRGFGVQVDNAAGIMRWYYDHKDQPAVKKINTPIRIDNTDVTPQSWATAFLYTYTPHLHGNRNFWRIWSTWFEQVYPNGTLLKSSATAEMWLLQDGVKRKFKNHSALVTRADPKLAIAVSEADLNNYKTGPEIAFSNYSLLQTASTTYLLDYDTLRPFASAEVIRELGYNPDEFIDVSDSDLVGYATGAPITASTTAPLGVIFRIADAPRSYYLLKDNTLYPILDEHIVATNFKNLPTEKHKLKELSRYPLADQPITFADGTLLQIKDNSVVYVMDKGKRRRLADEDTFVALGYKRSNIIKLDLITALNIPQGEPLYYNSALASTRSKFLGESNTPVEDLYGATTPSYLVAEYPSGRIISGKGVDDRRSIASLTKLLTAYEAVSQNFKLTGSTVYDTTLYDAGTNTINLKQNEKIKNSDLLNAMLIASVNRAAQMVTAATGLSEPEMVSDVNRRLEAWGADNTTLHDVTGLDEQNKSSARDLLLIFTKVLSNKTLKTILGKTTYSFRGSVAKAGLVTHKLKNTNQIMFAPKRGYRILASKTGYTDEANAVIIMLIQSKSTKKQYVIISMGNKDYKHRFEEPNKIAEWVSAKKLKPNVVVALE